MTNFNFPERWLNDRRLSTLPADDLRAFLAVSTYCVANRNDGHLERADLDALPWRVSLEHIDRLVAARLYAVTDRGWEMVDFGETQTSRQQLEAGERARKLARERQQRHRDRLSDNERDSLRDVTRDDSSDRDSARDSTSTDPDHSRTDGSTPDPSRIEEPRQAAKLPPARPSASCLSCGKPTTMAIAGRCRSCSVAAKRSA